VPFYNKGAHQKNTTLGTGYGLQYIEWFIALLLLLNASEDKKTRLILKILFVVAIVTYTVEYALFPSHGSFLLINNTSHFLQDWGHHFVTQSGQTLVRLPLFCCYAILFGFSWSRFKT